MLRFSGYGQYPGNSVLDELQLSNGLLWKAGEETITIIHPAGDKGMNKFLQVLTGNKTSNTCNVFEMIVCWFSYCFDMTTKTKVCLQNHNNIFELIFSCLTPRVNVCIHLENFIFVSKCNDLIYTVYCIYIYIYIYICHILTYIYIYIYMSYIYIFASE